MIKDYKELNVWKKGIEIAESRKPYVDDVN